MIFATTEDNLNWYLENDLHMTTTEKKQYLESIINCAVALGRIEKDNQYLQQLNQLGQEPGAMNI